MKIDVECPKCGHEFEADEWLDDECPKCKAQYYWDEQFTEDLSDSWSYVLWK